jgi:phosphoglycerol transferase MdoB-like AlkP superfamily enzyme
MKSINLKIQYLIFILVFIFLNIINTYFLTIRELNRYIEPFTHTFIGEINQFFGNFAVLFLLFVIVTLIFKKAKTRIKALIYISLILNFLIYTFGVFNLFYGTAFSRDAIVMLKNPADGFAFGIVLETLLELVTYYRIVVFLPTITLFILFLISSRDRLAELTFKNNIKKVMIALIALISIFFVSLNNYFNMKAIDAPVESMTSTYAIQNLGVYPYYLGQLMGVEFDTDYEEILNINNDDDLFEAFDAYNKNKASYINFFDGNTYSNRLMIEDAVSNLYVDPELSTSTDLTGIFKDKNLVLIHLESMNQFLLDHPEIRAFMPFMDAIFKESFVFNNFYNNVGMGVSSDGELAVLTGLNPSGDETLYWEYNKTPYELTSLVKYFNQANYYTEAIHGDKQTFYNRDVIYPEFYGFDAFYAIEDFIEDGYVIEEGYLFDENEGLVHHSPWISDFHLADFTYELGKNLETTQEPYFLFPITMMGHTPYDYDPYGGLREDQFPEFADLIQNITLRYINYSKYYNDIIQRFFMDEHGNDQTLDDSVYVFYSDHGSGIKNGDLSILFDKNLDPMEERKMLQQVTAFIYAPSNDTYVTHGDYTIRKGLITGEQDLVRSQIDLYRTITELFDLPAQNDMYFGVHGMSVEPTYALDNRLTDVALDQYFFSLRNRNRIYPNHEVVSDEVYNYILRYKLLSDFLLSKSDLQKILNEMNHA